MKAKLTWILLTLAVVGCSDDDDAPSSPGHQFCGKIASCDELTLNVSLDECARRFDELFAEVPDRCQECMLSMTCAGLYEFYLWSNDQQDSWPCASQCP
jgi:hypothetical protein